MLFNRPPSPSLHISYGEYVALVLRECTRFTKLIMQPRGEDQLNGGNGYASQPLTKELVLRWAEEATHTCRELIADAEHADIKELCIRSANEFYRIVHQEATAHGIIVSRREIFRDLRKEMQQQGNRGW